MTVFSPESANQIAEFNASRDVQEAGANAVRLAAWKARYPYGVTDVPAASEPPNWPAHRSSLSVSATVTRLPTKARTRHDGH